VPTARHPLAVCLPGGTSSGHLACSDLAADTSTVTTTSSIASQRAVAWSRLRIGTPAVLAGLVAASALIRSVVAVAHVAPGYFPDEYIYASLSRSLASQGRPLIRGGAAHFPALLEPLLAAPFWRLFPVVTAYHLLQVVNATAMSLAAIPVYLLARRLELGNGYALMCAAFAVALPDLAFSGSIIADPLAYTLALSAFYAGVIALETATTRAQLAFVSLAALATFARAQYAILLPAFLLATLAVDRRAFLRRHRLPFALAALLVAAALAQGPGKALGYYSVILHLHVGLASARWLGLTLFLLALTGAVVLIPGALVGLIAARGRRQVAFSALAVPFSLGLLFEAALYAAAGLDQFKERYAFCILPLVPIAFGIYLKRGRPLRLPVTAIAALILLSVARIPLSSYAIPTRFDDSPFLWAVAEVEAGLGVGTGSLLVALAASAAAILAAAVAWTHLRYTPIVVSLLLLAAFSVGASIFDVTSSRAVRKALVAPDPTWIDDAQVGPVSAIETPAAPRGLIEQLFWNTSIVHELLLGRGADPTDAFASERLTVRSDGTLITARRPLSTAILFDGFLATAVFRGVVPAGRFDSLSLWRRTGTPRLRVLELGRYPDGWLDPSGSLEVWPGSETGTVRFILSLPRSHETPVTVRFGRETYRLSPGERRVVRLPLSGPDPSVVPFRLLAGGSVIDRSEPVSVRSTIPSWTAAAR
jgi:hypothetical protein